MSDGPNFLETVGLVGIFFAIVTLGAVIGTVFWVNKISETKPIKVGDSIYFCKPATINGL